MGTQMLGSLLAAAVMAILVGLGWLLVGRAGWEVDQILLTGLIGGAVVFVAFMLGWRRYVSFLRGIVANIATGAFRGTIGLVRVYPSFDIARKDIVHCFKSAEEVRIFIQLGRKVIAGDESLLFKAAKERAGQVWKLRVLYADQASPEFSPERLATKGYSADEIVAAIEFTEGSLRALRQRGIDLSEARHREAFLWRLFFMDRVLFVMPYLYPRENTARAPVFRFEAGERPEASLYWTFGKYFERLWSESLGAIGGRELG